jgi:hypothetical protein
MATINDLYELDSKSNTSGIDAGAQAIGNLQRATEDLGTTAQEVSGGVGQAEESISGLGERIKETGDKTRESSSSLVDFKAGLDMVKEAGAQAAEIIDKVLGATLDYNQAVDGISQSIGISAEEASKLTYAMKIVGVSQGEVETAIRTAISKGIDPSIAGMQKLADQYNSIQDPIKRSQLLLDTFGRSGLAMGDLLEQGSEGIKAISDQAEQYGLVLDDKAIESSKRFEMSLQTFQARLDGVKVSIGNSLIDTFNTLPGPMQEVIALTVQMSTELGPVIAGGASLIRVFQEFGPGMSALKGGFEALKTGGAALTAELGLLAAGMAIIAGYLDRVSKATQATTDDLIKMSHSGDVLDQAAASTEIMIHGQDRLKTALDGTHEKIKSGAKNYDDYKSSIEATAAAAGYEIDADGNLVKVRSGLGGTTRELVQANYELSEGGYAIATSAEAHAAAQELANKALAAFNALSGNAAGAAHENTAAYYGSRDALREMYTAQRDANQWIADGTARMTDLKVVMAGAIKNEMTQYGSKQDDLKSKAQSLGDQIAALEAKQGRAVVTQKKDALSKDETIIATDKLATAQGKLAETSDPVKQAELRIEIDKIQGSLNTASSAVTSYIDNSKKIGELKGQYDEINKEIQANADAHDAATKKILFGYAEQQLAVSGLSEAEALALDALAVKWNLKSQEDINAMRSIRDAGAQLASDGSIDDFVNNVDGALSKANEKADGSKQKFDDMASSYTALGSHPPIDLQVGVDTASAEASVTETAKNLQALPPIKIPAAIEVAPVSVQAMAGDSMKERLSELRTARSEIEKPITAMIMAQTTQAQVDLKAVQTGQQAIAPVVQSAVTIDNSQAIAALQQVLSLIQQITGTDMSGAAPTPATPATPAQRSPSGGDYADRMRARGMSV